MTRRDILENEQRLRAGLHGILPFEAHALYFPCDDEPLEPVWLPEESRLLLPLRRNGELLGVFMMRGVDAGRVEAILPELPAVAGLCLDNLDLYRTGRLDADTGLATRQVLMERLREEADRIRAPFDVEAGQGEESTGDGCFGLGMVRFPTLEALARQWGHSFALQVLGKLAAAFRSSLPEGVVAARAGDDVFAVFFPGGERNRCVEALTEALRQLEGVHTPAPVTGRAVGVQACAGLALYPQDMDGDFADLREPAPALAHKAGLALDVACARPVVPGHPRIMVYGRILAEGGVIRQVLPLSRVVISLGRGVGVREGQCFSVWSVAYPVQGEEAAEMPLQPLYKGEIVVLEARETEAVAEILHLGDPSWPMQPGDTLAHLPRNTSSLLDNAAPSADPQVDALTGLSRHGDFLARMARAREGLPSFALAMVHLATPPGEDQYRMAQVARLCRETFVREGLGDMVLGGRFATSTLVFFHPTPDMAALTGVYENLCRELSSQFGACASGLAAWPFLRYHPADMLECCRKALEYALLLPEPHVGVLDSLALNISADKLHCRGDVFGAVEEYKLALLADADNALAWNSLGVCMAGLGRHDEARGHFCEALKRTPDDPALAYNLGVACQRLGDFTEACARYRQCLSLSPSHLFARLRLGQIAEREGDVDAARAHYLEAAAQDAGSALPHRHLARLALREDKPQAARECLHQALQCNPRDAESLALLGRLYLDGGEDPELAEALARQSVALLPDHKNGWMVLARAFEARGMMREAREAYKFV